MDTPEYQNSSTLYDAAFQEIKCLTWLPWVGQHYSERPPNHRLLVVGESHYYKQEKPEQTREAWLNNSQSTREVVSESLIDRDWTTRTLTNIPNLFFKTTEIYRLRLWADSAYCNIVQRPMDYNLGDLERPKWEDYVAGWKVFAEVVRIIQPSHCLFIGVAAADIFNSWIATQNIFSGNVARTEKIGRTWGRAGKIEVAGTTAELMFVQHLGKYFNWEAWHDYLLSQHPDFMKWLQAESYVTSQNV